MNQFRMNGGARTTSRGGWPIGLGLMVMLAAHGPAIAAGVEQREFRIHVDNKPAGTYQMTITTQDNGTTVVSCQGKVEVTKLGLRVYSYTYRGTETWQGNRLIGLDSSTNDNGTTFVVKARAEGNNLRVAVNGQERLSRWDVWTTTYWRLPEAKFRNGGVPLLDADTGRPIDGQMRYVGTSVLVIGGQTQNCPHYRVTGKGIEVDVWYDAQERMIRQESVEDGHRTLFELTGLRR